MRFRSFLYMLKKGKKGGRRSWKKTGLLVFAAALGGIISVPGTGLLTARATVAVQASPVTEYDEAALASFADDTLEYWEIPGLVERYNSAYQKQLDQFYYNPGSSTGLTKDQLLSVAETLRQEAETLADTAEDEKDSITKQEYEEYRNNVRILRARAKDLEDAAKGWSASGASALRALRISKNNTVKTVNAMMRDHEILELKTKAAEKSLEMAELTYEAAKRQMELGLYSAENVLAAEEVLNSARAAASSAENEEKDQKQTLIRMLGWRYDADPAIQKVPEPDLARIASYDLAADISKAIENNVTLYDTRMASSSSQGGAVAKARTIKDQENEVRTSLDLLYKDVLQKQAAYGADKAAADRKNALGMMSRQEYLTAESAYLAAEAEFTEASLALTGAMEEYEWAVKGMMELASGAQSQGQGAM